MADRKTERVTRLRLIVMSFLQFAVWGAYLPSLGRYLGQVGLGPEIKWFFALQGIVSLFMPALAGIVADRLIPAQKLLSFCHALAGTFMISAGAYSANIASAPEFTPLFVLYGCSVAFYMPTISLSSSVAYHALSVAGMDPVINWPPIRAFGTVGFIFCMLAVNWLKVGGVAIQNSHMQLFLSGALSLVLSLYSLSLPRCKTNSGKNGKSFAESLGIKALYLFRQRRMAVFFLFAMMIGAAMKVTDAYSNTFLASFGAIPQFADSFAVRNSNALLAISQTSETLCILLIPFFMKRFGIKKVMLISVVAWTLRFGFFAIGEPDMPRVLFLILSCMVYGVAFDFFNVSGSLFVEQNSDSDIRSSAQGLMILMTNGLGGSIGTLAAGSVVDRYVYEAAAPSWPTVWAIFATYVLVVGILFAFLFKEEGGRKS